MAEPMTDPRFEQTQAQAIPVVEEQLRVGKREQIDETLRRTEVDVEDNRGARDARPEHRTHRPPVAPDRARSPLIGQG
jgi:hypothetical protein